jgi:hypothetical protein
MRILDETRVILSLDGDDPWTERRSSDWNIGDAPPDETDSTQLALVPVESIEATSGRPDPIVASLFAHPPIASLSRRRTTVRSA